MGEDIFQPAEEAIKAAGSDDPRDVAEHFGIMVVDLKGTIAGYATRYSKIPVIGLNVYLDDLWYRFGGWHELDHVFSGDIYNPGFTGGHRDGGFFTQDVDSRTIPRHELRANLVSANVNIKDDIVIEVTNYNSRMMQDYRKTRAYLEKLSNAYEQLRFSTSTSSSGLLKAKMHELRRKIQGTSETLMDIETEMISSNCCKTFHEMACEVGVPERIFRYKLEAMRLRGYDIDPQELERYDEMFKGTL